jgi:hypothetical protein
MLLNALARFRMARTSDLVRYSFGRIRPDTASVRLRRLFDVRLLAVQPPALGVENIYRLGPAGKKHLAKQGIEVGRVPRGGLDHHLAIVQAWVAVASLEGVELERCLPDWELREKFSATDLRIVPDLFMLARAGPDIQAIAVEVDCGTESVRTLNRKIEMYRTLWGRAPGLFGWERFGLAVACCGPSNHAAISAALKKAWVVPHALWVCQEGPRSALYQLFEELKTPLSASPYPKGRLREASR